MESGRRLSLVVGGFALLCLAVLAAVVLSLSAERGLWSPRYRLVAFFGNVEGLIAGAPVHVSGKQVGRVEAVSFAPLEGEGGRVRVGMLIDREVQDRIRSDSVATIGTIGLLGDKYVSIAMGSAEGTVLQEGATIETVSPLDLNEVALKGAEALDNIARLTSNANAVLEDFGARVGGRKMADSLQALAEIVNEVQDGSGLLHSLIYDEYEGGGVQSIDASLASLERILAEVEQGDGVLHSLIYDAPSEQDVVMQAVQAGARLNSILAKIDSGQGTLGLLLTDPTLYDDLKQLLGGAERSLVVRSLLRMARDAEADGDAEAH